MKFTKLYALSLMIGSLPVLATTPIWVKDGTAYVKDGEITLKRESGSDFNINLNTKSASRESQGRTPNIMVVGSGGDSSVEYLQALVVSSGDVLVNVVFDDMTTWVTFSSADFANKFTYKTESQITFMSKNTYYNSESASASGSCSGANHEYRIQFGGENSCSCQLSGGPTVSDTGERSAYASYASSVANMSCSAVSSYSYHLHGSLTVWTYLESGLVSESAQCSEYMFYINPSNSDTSATLSGSGGGSSSITCGATGSEWARTIDGVNYGFSKNKYYNEGVVTSMSQTINFTQITNAYVDTSNGTFYILRGKDLYTTTPSNNENESFVTTLVGTNVSITKLLLDITPVPTSNK
ncbi:hypothetical protein [Pseudoalteromonas sp. MEBiC 03485]|uniref:hypothetical protein n=1 Tax=Pseudoalteromonas sp. MEBiC 03485 TaxID=2571103 RepID=UPI0010206A73|nr:hypothetical protein [Pseudoalteromonas sp. MEBiC 03485]RZD19640.1 hypothetical protein EVU92_20785 [Pseudoalteromonas sp. MEBiC 03485]